MADIRPFRGLRYDPRQVSPDAVIAPPYDVVDDAEAQALRDRSPHTIAHVEMRRESASYYDEAADALRRWTVEGALVRDDAPAYYLYEQRFTVQGGRRARRVFFARLRLYAPEDGVVRPHEGTMAGPVEDRLRLLRATATNVSPILAMFEDRDGGARAVLDRVAGGEPVFEAHDGLGDRHRLWVIDAPEQITTLTAAVGASRVTIADGHHRYRTALEHMREQPSEATGWMLAGLVAGDDPGLAILPAHRMLTAARLPHDFVERLSELYEVDDITPKSYDGTAVQRLWGRVQANALGPPTFGALGIEEQQLTVLTARSRAAIDAAMPGDWSAASRGLDVAVLTETILRPLLGIDQAALADAERVHFTEDVEEAWAGIERGRYPLALLVNPVRVEQVMAVADAGELMPPKSTYFYPKLYSGMVLNPLD